MSDLVAEIEAKFDRVIVPLTDEQVAVIHAKVYAPDEQPHITASESLYFIDGVESDISCADAMEKLRAKVMAYLGNEHVGGWIAWRHKPEAIEQRSFERGVTTYRAYVRFNFCPTPPTIEKE